MALTPAQIAILKNTSRVSLNPQMFNACALAPKSYEEVLQPYDPSKAIPSAILLKGMPCSTEALQCYVFKEYIWDACKARLQRLVTELNGILIGPIGSDPIGATERQRAARQAYLAERTAKLIRKAEIIEEIFFACNEALDATNIKNYWLYPAGLWSSSSFPQNLAQAQSPEYKVCPASARPPVNFLEVYGRVQARLNALGTLTGTQKNLFPVSRMNGVASWDWRTGAMSLLMQPGDTPFWVARECTNLWRGGYRDRYSYITSSFYPRQSPFLFNGKVNDLYRDPETRFQGYFDHGFFVKYYESEVVPLVFVMREAEKAEREPRRERRRRKIRSFFKKVGAAVASPLGPFTPLLGTTPEGGKMPADQAKALADGKARAGVLGPKKIEEFAKLWANEIIGTSYKDVLVAGIYNYVFQTEMMIFSGLAEEGAGYVAALEDSLKGTIKSAGDTGASVFSSVGGVWGAVLGAIAKVLLLALIPLIDKLGVAVGCIPGFLDVPVIRIPENIAAVETDACSGLRGQISPEQYNSIRTDFFPKIEQATGAAVSQFRFATDEELFEQPAPDGTMTRNLLLAGGAVILIGGIGYAAFKRKP